MLGRDQRRKVNAAMHRKSADFGKVLLKEYEGTRVFAADPAAGAEDGKYFNLVSTAASRV